MTAIHDTMPGVDTPQRREAREKANAHRLARARWKRDVKTRRVDPTIVIADPGDVFATLKVYDVLMSLPRFGQGTAGRVLRLLNLAPAKQLGKLTPRQREELIHCVQSGPVTRRELDALL